MFKDLKILSKNFSKTLFQFLITNLVVLGFLNASTIYVDNQLSNNCSGNYSIENRDCSGSDGDAYKTLAGASNVAVAGDDVFIRGGVYSEQLSPENSGEPGKYITYKNYPNEIVEITGKSLSPAIWIFKKNYIAIDGLVIRDVRRWLNALGSDYLIIRNNTFERANDPYGSSKTGLFLQSSSYVKIQNNKIHDTTQDNLGMVDCDYNLIEGNSFIKAVHTLWALKCSNYNIIRNNYFHNEIQKIGEIYDCDEVGYGEDDFPKYTSLDDAKFNVVEGNIFAHTASSGDASPYAGIQYAGQKGIIRNNVFYDCIGPPFDFTLYGSEAKYNYGNRVYNNTFYNNDFGGISITGNTSYTFYDQKVKNNILYRNRFIQNDMRWSWYAELDHKPLQIMTGRTADIVFKNNNIFSLQKDELYAIAYGSRTSSSNPDPETLSWWETNHSTLFSDNIQENPEFIDTTNYNFHLSENSAMIDAAAFLARTTSSAANSTTMEVDDAGWFIDGFGIVDGDTVQLEGQTDRAIILSIDYVNNKLTLDRPLSWESNQGVSLKYVKESPDIGAFEFHDESTSLPEKKNNSKLPNTIGLNCYPNPFNPSTVIYYEFPNSGHVELKVYNSTGKLVTNLVRGYRRAGVHKISWDPENGNKKIASGIYVLHLKAGDMVKQIKMIYLK